MAIKFLNTVAVDTDVLYADAANNRVGIGTTSPQSKLHIETTGGSTLTIQNTTNSGNAALNFRDEGDNDQFQIYYALGANRSYNLVNGNGLTIYSSQSSSEIARFGNAGNGYTNSYFTGNVGIGTTSPTEKLSISGAKNTPIIHLGSTTNNSSWVVGDKYGAIEFGSADGSGAGAGVKASISYEVALGVTGSTNSMVFRTAGTATGTNNTSRMVIDSAGRVGIGTTNPQDALDVDWDTEGVATDNSGIRVRAYRPHLNLIDRSGYTASNGHNFQIKADGAKLQFNATSADDETFDLTRMVIDKDGNVGIGTDSPSKKLHLSSTSNNGSDILQQTDGSRIILLEQKNGSIHWQLGTFGTTGGGANNRYSIKNATTGVEALVIHPTNNNIGIGTTSPTSELHIEASDNPNLLITRQGVNKVLLGDSGSNNGGDLLLYNAGGTLTTLIRSGSNSYLNGGNVGIGTTSPSNKLSLAGSGQNWTTSPGIKMWDSFNSKGWYVGSANNHTIGDFYIRSVTAENLYPVSANQQFTIKQSGNVGIGTISPFSKLHVSGGDIELDDGYEVKFNVTGAVTAEEELVLDAGNTDSKIILDGADSAMQFITGNSTAIAIDDSQNVGIGTTAPSQKLHVAGNMRLQNQLYDSTNSLGSNNQVLTKVSAGTQWKDAPVNAQMPDNTAPASAANVGTIRYRSTSNTSFVDVSMQTGATTYTWVNIVSNFW